MKSCQVIDTGIQSAKANMELDVQLLESLDGTQSPIFHFYEWDAHSATHGHFIDPSKHLNMDVVAQTQLQLAKRPTGGGIIFHFTDFAFSFLMPAGHPDFSPNTLDNYAYVNGLVSNVLTSMMGSSAPRLLGKEELSDPSPSFCMANPTVFDVMVNGQKVGGAAQRRTKKGYLHQGSIFLAMPQEDFLESIILDKKVLEGMKANSYPLLGADVTPSQIQEAKDFIKRRLLAQLASTLYRKSI